MNRVAAFIYGVFSYLVFIAMWVYTIGFMGNVIVSKTIDSGPEASFVKSLFVNIILLALWAAQHSIMARQNFKDWWTKIVPKPIERSTYVLIASLLMVLILHQWRPMPTVIWNIENALGYFTLTGLYYIGWLTVLYSTFLIHHFDLFGLRHVYLYLLGREYTPLEFRTPSLYKFVRHPLMLGFFLAFWATPRMTIGHLVFAIAMTVYIIIGTILEERDLVNTFGETYINYRRQVPIFPLPRKNRFKLETNIKKV
jgi:protein-S-isoprenylcysteine O-methyltransferase Ste14